MKTLIAMIIVTLLSLSLITACSIVDTQGELSNSSNLSEISETSATTDLSEGSSVADESSDDSSKPDVSDESSISETSDESTESETSSDDIASKINEYLDVILKDVEDNYFKTNKKEDYLAETFSDEFSAIISYGEEAFTALDNIIDDPEVSITRRAMAKYAKYIIKPELYELSFLSPDEKYSIKCSVYSFVPVYTSGELRYCDFRLVDEATGSTLATSDISEVEFYVHWSENSKYAAIYYGNGKYYYETNVFDVQNAQYIELPTSNDIKELTNFNEDVSYFSSTFKEWTSDDEIKISVLLKGSEGGTTFGWYIYDFIEQKIVDSQL